MNEPFCRFADTNTNYPYYPSGRPEHDTTEPEVSDCSFSLLVDP